MASTSCAFFMEPLPAMPMPPAIALRSASSIALSPPVRFFGPSEACFAAVPFAAGDASGAAVVESKMSVT